MAEHVEPWLAALHKLQEANRQAAAAAMPLGCNTPYLQEIERLGLAGHQPDPWACNRAV